MLEHEAWLRVYYDKTEILRLGSIRATDFKLTTEKPYKWTNDPVEILGIWLNNDSSNLFKLNITSQLQKIGNLIKISNTKNMTLYDRVIIVKTS